MQERYTAINPFSGKLSKGSFWYTEGVYPYTEKPTGNADVRVTYQPNFGYRRWYYDSTEAQIDGYVIENPAVLMLHKNRKTMAELFARYNKWRSVFDLPPLVDVLQNKGLLDSLPTESISRMDKKKKLPNSKVTDLFNAIDRARNIYSPAWRAQMQKAQTRGWNLEKYPWGCTAAESADALLSALASGNACNLYTDKYGGSEYADECELTEAFLNEFTRFYLWASFWDPDKARHEMTAMCGRDKPTLRVRHRQPKAKQKGRKHDRRYLRDQFSPDMDCCEPYMYQGRDWGKSAWYFVKR